MGRISKNSEYIHYGATNNYIIFTDEGMETGIFFRSPIRKITYEVYPYSSEHFSLAIFAQDCKDSILFRIYQYILGNKELVKSVMKEDLFKDPYLFGMEGNIVISPIYFKRKYRALDIINMNDDIPINYISSFGYEDEYNMIAGYCTKETTVIHHKYKKKETRLRTGNKYLYTYLHIAKELIKTLETKETRISEPQIEGE